MPRSIFVTSAFPHSAARTPNKASCATSLPPSNLAFVPPESILLIESLDRLSRAEVLEAHALFLQIINAGITIVTLIDGRSYSKSSLNSNPVDLLILYQNSLITTRVPSVVDRAT